MAIEVAQGIHDHPHLKLGAVLGSGRKDNRTVLLDDLIKTDMIAAPASWDFDKGRKAFAAHMWGNADYGDCEIAGRCNYLVRLERVETRGTVSLTDEDAVDCYKEMTGCQSPGDNNDVGLTTLDNLNQWRHSWQPKSQKHPYSIDAYGLVSHTNDSLTRLASYLFHGIIIGAALPIAAQSQFDQRQIWDVVNDSSGEPGSWGGHCMYGKAYDRDHMKLLTWSREIIVTNAWWHTYVDEAYCVIDSLDTWRSNSHAFDVNALIAEMRQAGINVEQ